MFEKNVALRLLLLCGLLLGMDVLHHHAQQNLLSNPGFNQSGQYSATAPYFRGDFNFAPGWSGWQTNSPSTETWMNIDAIAFPHTGSLKREGDASQNIGRGDATFTAAAYQTIDGITEGTALQASVWVFQENDEASDARTRIGIGSNSGGNPNGGAVTWSPWLRALRSWQQISVEATVPAGNVTVFIQSTQSFPNEANQVYYDDAQLVIVGEGAVNVGDASNNPDEAASDAVVPPPPTSVPQFAPFVQPQEAGEAGRIEHSVQPGDTLAAIAVAYGVPMDEIRQLNNLESDILQIGQVLLIQEQGAQPPTEIPAAAEAAAEDAEETSEVVLAGADDSTAESTGEPSPTRTPTERAQLIATQEDEEATDEPTPGPTAIPVTPTDAPPAPVASGADADPLDIESGVCLIMFEDGNQNRLQDNDEDLLAGGIVTIRSTLSDDTRTYETDGISEPFCYEDLQPGTYTAEAAAPGGYGITTSNSLAVSVQPGQVFQLRFGAVQGVEAAVAPTADVNNAAIDGAPEIIDESPDDGFDISSIAGFLVLGLAGVVLLGGVGIALIVNRR